MTAEYELQFPESFVQASHPQSSLSGTYRHVCVRPTALEARSVAYTNDEACGGGVCARRAHERLQDDVTETDLAQLVRSGAAAGHAPGAPVEGRTKRAVVVSFTLGACVRAHACVLGEVWVERAAQARPATPRCASVN